MVHKISTIKQSPISLRPTSVLEEVLQNIQMILSTPRGSQPLDRDFGIDYSLLDRSPLTVQTLLVADLVEQVERFEPRAKVHSVGVEYDRTGKAVPYTEVSLRE